MFSPKGSFQIKVDWTPLELVSAGLVEWDGAAINQAVGSLLLIIARRSWPGRFARDNDIRDLRTVGTNPFRTDDLVVVLDDRGVAGRSRVTGAKNAVRIIDHGFVVAPPADAGASGFVRSSPSILQSGSICCSFVISTAPNFGSLTSSFFRVLHS